MSAISCLLLFIITIALESESKPFPRECNALASFQPGPCGEICRGKGAGSVRRRSSRRSSGVFLNSFLPTLPMTSAPSRHRVRPTCFSSPSIPFCLSLSKNRKSWPTLFQGHIPRETKEQSLELLKAILSFCLLRCGPSLLPGSALHKQHWPGGKCNSVVMGVGVPPKLHFFSLLLRMRCLYLQPNYSSSFNFASFPSSETEGKHRKLLK